MKIDQFQLRTHQREIQLKKGTDESMKFILEMIKVRNQEEYEANLKKWQEAIWE